MLSRKDVHKCTQVPPNRRYINQIHYVLVNSRFKNSNLNVKMLRRTNIGYDHFLLGIRIRIMWKIRKKQRIKRTLQKPNIIHIRYNPEQWHTQIFSMGGYVVWGGVGTKSRPGNYS